MSSVSSSTPDEPQYLEDLPPPPVTASHPSYDGNMLSKREQKRRPKPKDRSVLICHVCGDRALGYNFDAITCESCKAFFRRNALKNKSFACSFDGNCKLDAHTRKFCSGCRLKKCFDIGMKKDWILTDTQLEKRRKKSKSQEQYDEHEQQQHFSPTEYEDSQVSSVGTNYEVSICTPAMPGSVSCGDSTTCSPTSQSCTSPQSDIGVVTTPLSDHGSFAMVKLEALDEEDFIHSLPEDVRVGIEEVTTTYHTVFDAPYNRDQETKLKKDVRSADELFNMTDMFIKRLIKFAKSIPEFRALKQEDQIALLKGGVMEIMYLRSAMGFDERRKSWIYQGTSGTGKIKAEVLHSLSDNNFKEHISFVMGLHQLCRNDHIIMILLFVVELFSPDRPNLRNKELVSDVQEKFSEWMRLYLESVYPQSEARSLYPKLLMKLTDVRTLGESSSQMAAQLDISRMEPLLVEVFNLKH